MQGRSDLPGTRTQNIDAGINYGRGLWLSPRTSIGFSTGSAIVSALDGRHFELTGSAFVKQQISARWTAQASVTRGLQAVDTRAASVRRRDRHRHLRRLFLAPRRDARVAVAQPRRRRRDRERQLSQLCEYLARRVGGQPLLGHSTPSTITSTYRSTGLDLPGTAPALDRQGLRTGLTLWAPLVR
jgi:hypothetical protein